jgi:hypothetical protein
MITGTISRIHKATTVCVFASDPALVCAHKFKLLLTGAMHAMTDEDQLEYEAALESDGFCSVHRHCGSAVCSVLQRTCSVKPYICYRKRKSAYTLVVSKSIKLN